MKRFLQAILLVAVMAMPMALRAQGETLTVADGTTTNNYVPFYGNYCDEFIRTQIIYPESQLSDMAGSSITQISFYLSSAQTVNLTATFEVRLGSVANSYFASASWDNTTPMTTVYTGGIDITNTLVTLEFDTPYIYDGGNLMLEVWSLTNGNYKSTSWKGITMTGASISGYNSSNPANATANNRNFLPKTTFSYEPVGVSCPKPAAIAISNVQTHSAYAHFTPGGSETSWLATINPAVNGISSMVLTDTAIALTGLDDNTTYNVSVAAICGAGDTSTFRNGSFTTPCDPFALSATNPFVEDFENGISACYQLSRIEGSGSVNWSTSTSNAHSGTHSGYIGDQSATTRHLMVLTQMTKASNESYMLSFWAWRLASTSYGAKVLEGVRAWYNTTPDTVGGTVLAYHHRNVDLGSPASNILYEAMIPNTADTFYIIFEGINEYGGASYIDDIEISLVPSCIRPNNVAVSDVTTTTANISWNRRDDSQHDFVVGYAVYGDNNWTDVANATDTSAVLTGLIPNTPYQVRVKAVCSSDDQSDWSEMASFRTACTAIEVANLPYTETFEAYASGSNNQIDPCWTKGTNSSTAYPYPSSTYGFNGSSRSLYFSGSSTNYSYVALPMVDANVNSLMMTFQAYKSSASYGYIQIGTMSDPADASTFTMMDTLYVSESSTWTEFEYMFNNYNGTDNYIALYVAGNPVGNTQNVYIDDITVDIIPSCWTINDLHAIDSMATATSLTVAWTERNTGANAWYVGYKTAEDTAYTYAVMNSNPCTINGLEGNTIYTISVAPICAAGDTAYAKTCTGRTACPEFVNLPYAENFDSYTGNATSTTAPSNYPGHTLPSCWNIYGLSTSTTTYPQAFLTNTSAYAVNGNCLFLKSSSTTPVTMALPAFNASAALTEVNFTYRNEGIGGGNGTLYLGVMTDPSDEETFMPLYACPQTTTKTQVYYDLSLDTQIVATDFYTLAFRYVGGTSNNYYVAIDDISVKLAPTCKLPVNLAVSASNDTIRATWQARGNSSVFDFGYGPQGVDEADLTIISDINADSIITTLPTGVYDVYVRTNCGTETSEWVGPVTTASNAIMMNGQVLSGSKYVIVDNGGLSGVYANYSADTVTFIATEECATYRISGTIYTENNYDYVTIFTDTTSTYAARFSGEGTHIDFTAPNGYLKVVFSSDNSTVKDGFALLVEQTGRATQLPIAESFENGIACNWVMINTDGQATSDLIGTTLSEQHTGSNCVVFSSFDSHLDVDQYLISPEFTSDSMVDLSFWAKASNTFSDDQFFVGVSTTDNNVESFTWTEIEKSSSWNMFQTYLPAGIKYVAFHYTGNYGYRFYVDDINIQYAPSCLPLNEVVVSNVTDTAATISWTLNDETQNNFVVAYGTGNDPDQMETLTVTTTSVVLSGLSTSTTYNVYVKAVCDTNNFTPWTLPVSFTSDFCSAENKCNITILASDEYGDGWNFASIDVIDSLTGTIVATIEPVANYTYSLETDTIQLSLCDGRTYNFVWNEGSYDDEAGVVILNSNGRVIYTNSDMSTIMGTLMLSYTHSCAVEYELIAEANDTLMGTVTGSGIYTEGDTATLTATAVEHYHFVSWNDGNIENPRQVVMNSDANFVATFAIDQFTIMLGANDTNMGTVEGAGIYNYGDTATLIATAAEHYHFVMWNDSVVDNPRVITVEEDVVLNAIFAPETYTITANANEAAMGTIEGAGSYNYGETATLTATAAAHYHFVMWNDSVVENPRAIVVEGDMTLTAIFEADIYTITASANDTNMGTVTGAGEYAYGQTVTLTANAKEGYRFVSWSNGETTATITFTAEEDIELTATFEETEGIDDIDMSNINVVVKNRTIVVNGAEGMMLRIFDVQGRMLVNEKGIDGKSYTMPATGVYMVKVNNYPAKKVVVVR